jgi:phosphohistidine phosphatase
MALYFVQHGIALAKEVDPDRRLSPDGLKEVEYISAWLKRMGISVKKIYHSGKTRAMETAQIFTEKIGDGGISELPGMNPDDDVKRFVKFIKEDDVMYIGHLPHLERLVSYLITGDDAKRVVTFVNAGVVCIARDSAGFHVQWCIRPSMCEGAGS